MNEGIVKPERLRAVYCQDCSYCLAGVQSTQCPECGRSFDITDPSTVSADQTQNRTNAKALEFLHKLHRAFLALLVLTIVTLFYSAPLGMLFGLLLLACTVTMMATQTWLANKVFGAPYAAGHLVMAMVVSPFLMVGFILMPLIVRRDILRHWQFASDDV